jgi:hypothetical protein
MGIKLLDRYIILRVDLGVLIEKVVDDGEVSTGG